MYFHTVIRRKPTLLKWAAYIGALDNTASMLKDKAVKVQSGFTTWRAHNTFVKHIFCKMMI